MNKPIRMPVGSRFVMCMETGALLRDLRGLDLDEYLETCPECGIIEYEGCQCGLMEEE